MKKIMCFVSFAVMALMSVSCSNDELDNVTSLTNERVAHTATLVFDGNKPSFDDEGTTRAATDSWANGSKVYLQFTVGNGRVDGVATYTASTQEWSVEFYGALQATNDGKCEAYYFENAGTADYKSVTLTHATAIYVDKSASYSFEDNTVKVTANLKPMTGRMRLKGESNLTFYADGISFYTEYSITNNSFVTDNSTVTGNTAKDGYSSYIYGFFADQDNKEILFNDKDNNVAYTKVLGSNALSVGKSGYLNIPSLTSRSGWELLRYKDYEVGNVSFRMIRVVADFNTITKSYYIGETEVTQALWKAVMNNNPSNPTGDNLPVNGISRILCLQFIQKLNSKIGADFFLPTLEQWQFAAKGGNMTKGFTYSGSNNINDVAWYDSNSNSTTHEVKTKVPNEIDIYDMSGNVSEWTDSKYNNSYYYLLGGCWAWNEAYARLSYTNYTYPDNTDNGYGLRLASY